MFDDDRVINVERIENISKQIKAGAQYENPTIELKRQFWDLTDDDGKNKFAKDLTVMANSQYGAGNIIVGIDGNIGDLHHNTLPFDAANLANIINRKVLLGTHSLRKTFGYTFYQKYKDVAAYKSYLITMNR